MTTEVAVRDNGGPLTHVHKDEFTRERIELWKRTFCKGATDDELALFIAVCKRTGLSPEARQVFAVKRWDRKENREVLSIQISIDGFRVIAERSGKYAGQKEAMYCDTDGKWTDVWLHRNKFPKAVKVGVLRRDFLEPCYAIAVWESYCQTDKGGQPLHMWRNMPEVMLSKCAEALALRKAFPNELSGLYTNDEMAQASNEVPVKVLEAVATTTTPPVAETLLDEIRIKPDDIIYLAERSRKLLEAMATFHIDRELFERYMQKSVAHFTDKDFDACSTLYKRLNTGVYNKEMMANEIARREPAAVDTPTFLKKADPTLDHLVNLFSAPTKA